METVWDPNTPMPGNKYAYQIGWIQASEQITKGPFKGDYALVAAYNSSADSFKSAAAKFSNLKATDPATFAKNAAADHIEAGTASYFLDTQAKFAKCLGHQ